MDSPTTTFTSPPKELTLADLEKDPSLLAKALEESKTNPLKRARLLEALSGKVLSDPPSVKNLKKIMEKQNMPYYQEKYARELIPLLDEMIQTEEDYDLNIADVNAGRRKPIKVATLYNRVYASIEFICDNLDPTGEYNKFYKKIEIGRTDKGICLAFKEVLSGSLVWKKRAQTLGINEVLEYISTFAEEANDGQAFTIPTDDEKQELPMDLSDDEQEKCKVAIEKWSIVGVIGVVSRSEIKLAKRKQV